MKAKVLLVPLTLVISITLLIWFIYPLFGSIMETRKNLEAQRAKVVDLEDKIQKTKKLAVELNSNSSQQEKINKFLPIEQKAEEIIDNLNYLASQEGLSIFSLSVGKTMITPKPVSGVSYDINSSGDSPSSSGEEGAEYSTVSNVSNFKVEYGVVGGYTGIKNLLEKIRTFERFSRVDSIKIEKAVSNDALQNQAQPTDSLKVKMVLVFSYLEKLKSVTSINSQALSDGKFNMAAIEKLDESRKTRILTLDVKAAGKSNPFLP